MRFDEFALLEEDEPKFYAIGDQHAVGIADAGDWPGMASTGILSSNPAYLSAIDKIPKGKVIVISAGQNDATSTKDTPEQIAGRVSAIVKHVIAHGCTSVYLLFPSGGDPRKTQVREAIKSQVNGNVLDLDTAALDSNKVSLQTQYYGIAARSISAKVSAPVTTPSATTTASSNVKLTPNKALLGSQTKQARNSAEAYLGRKMSDVEWDHLLRATGAEASDNDKEQAWVMAAILNRARSGNRGHSDIIGTLKHPAQFQSVTGVKGAHASSSEFVVGPTGTRLQSILSGATKFLQRVPHTIVNFTAANEAAYKAGTKIAYKKLLLAKGGVQVGQTIFST